MKSVKRAACLGLSVLMASLMLAGCSQDKTPDKDNSTGSTVNEAIDIRMAVIKGPTGVGAVNLWANQDEGTASNR